MTHPSTPAAAVQSLFGGPVGSTSLAPSVASVPSSSTSGAPTPTSVASSGDTFVMPNSPMKNRPMMDGYRPKVTRTLGQRPACLVNASVTYCGHNQIYAFGGFDQYTDEVYNHVLKLDLVSHQWSLVDNYGDIPGVRMGHTATLYQGDKLLVFGGENEHRTYLSDLIVFDLKTAHWTQPQVTGPVPKGRARHAAVLHEDKLFIIGGITGHDNYVLDDICYLDLKTYTWSKSWRFVGRFDHSAYIWGDRVWVFGGLSEDMDKVSELWWLDLKGNPAFESPSHMDSPSDRHAVISRTTDLSRTVYSMGPTPVVGASGYAANSRTAQVNTPSFQLKTYAPQAPGSVASLKFVSGVNVPSQVPGTHFHIYSSGTLLDFVTPATTITSKECSLSALDLASLRWQKLAEGREIFKQGFRWHYCTMNEDGTKAWLLGCPTDPTNDIGPNGFEEYLSDIMEIDLRRYGFLGNNLSEPRSELCRPTPHARGHEQPSKGLGLDLAKFFNQPPEAGSGTDFVITALAGDYEDDDMMSSGLIRAGEVPEDQNWLAPDAPTSPPIYVHKLILQARWPHFARLYNAQMAEFHTRKMHIPEPYPVVKAFLYYLYTDSIHTDDGATDLSNVAGLLVMSNIYNIPHLRLLCVNRLSKELDVDHSCIIWYCASQANEEWLRKRAAAFCLTHWGRIVRTQGFLRLPRSALVELSQEIDMEGRVIGGEELDYVDSYRGRHDNWMSRKDSISSDRTQALPSDMDNDSEGMDLA
ncbi:kelch domain-containing protein [Xylaria intraflava]|nr:kelch domain-containing protein [Xylaria intraflava]